MTNQAGSLGPFIIDGWTTEGIKSNLLGSVVLADTGPLDGPSSHQFAILASSNIDVTLFLERRNSERAVIKSHRIDLKAGVPLSLSIALPVYIDDRESFTISCNAFLPLQVGSVQASIFFN